jgi:hypothetical protein
MKTNRTLEIIRTYNYAQKNHWQLMCDLSNNDYDISYFSGRETVNDNLNFVLQIQENEGFDIEDMLNQLQKWHDEGVKDQQEYYNENKCYNENTRGWLDEIQLMMKIIKQQY